MFDEAWLARREARLRKLYGGEKPLPTGAKVIYTDQPMLSMPSIKIELLLPFPPTLNHNLTAQRTLTAAHSQFRDEVAAAVNHKLRGHAVAYASWLPLEGRLHAEILVFAPDKRKRDIDNLIKPTLDALQAAGVFLDDNQFDCITIRRLPAKEGAGAAHVKIVEMS